MNTSHKLTTANMEYKDEYICPIIIVKRHILYDFYMIGNIKHIKKILRFEYNIRMCILQIAGAWRYFKSCIRPKKS